MSKEELELAIRVANSWSGRSTLILAVGILGEYVLLPFLENGRWKAPAKILFAVLVVAGVGGEYWFSGQIAEHADELQRKSDVEVASANRTASEAGERAGKAGERSANLEREAAVLRRQTEDEATARVKLEMLLGPRTLTAGQRQKIQSELSHLAGTEVDLFVFGGNEWNRFESLAFAKLLDSSLGKDGAGLDTREYFATCEPSQPIFGVSVFGFADTPLKDQRASAEIKQALKSSGIEMSEWTMAMPTCDTFFGEGPERKPRSHAGWANIRIIVGSKPAPMVARPTFPVPYR